MAAQQESTFTALHCARLCWLEIPHHGMHSVAVNTDEVVNASQMHQQVGGRSPVVLKIASLPI